jgi:NTP pyrophosphatase (non-canonical NTP hydrolase)
MIFNVLEAVKEVIPLEQKTLQELALKTSEETGELAQAVLSFTGAPGCAYKMKSRADLDEEAIDVIICAAATLFKNQIRPDQELQAVFEQKIEAWKTKIAKERK